MRVWFRLSETTRPVWVPVKGFRALPPPDERATLDYLPGSAIPVIRQPFAPGDLLPFWAYGMPVDDHHLYDADDVDETDNQAGSASEDDALELLRSALADVDAPDHQLQRLGLA